MTLNPDLKVTSNNSEMVQEILNLQWRRPIVISKSYRTAPYSATHSKDGDFLTVGPVTVATAVLSLDFSARILYE